MVLGTITKMAQSAFQTLFKGGSSKRPYGIENKSIQKGVKEVQFSSIKAWEANKLPKILIIWFFEKETHQVEGVKKGRDVQGTIVGYAVYFIENRNIVTPWPKSPSHSEITSWKWTDERNAQLKKLVEQQHRKYPSKIVKFAKSFKNGKPPNATCRIQFRVKDYTKLPKVPEEMKKERWYEEMIETLDKIVGAVVRLKKYNLPGLKGKRVFTTPEILDMEHTEKRRLEAKEMSKQKASQQSKDTGELFVTINGEVTHIPGFSRGREDHWTGDAIDHLLSWIDKRFQTTKSKTVGMDILPESDDD